MTVALRWRNLGISASISSVERTFVREKGPAKAIDCVHVLVNVISYEPNPADPLFFTLRPPLKGIVAFIPI
jgi:hypothetical protein